MLFVVGRRGFRMPHDGHDFGHKTYKNQDRSHHDTAGVENFTVEHVIRYFSAAQANVANDEQLPFTFSLLVFELILY